MFNPKLTRFAPIGLIIAGLAVLASAGLYIVYRRFDLPLQISLGMIVLGLALYVLLNPQGTRAALTGRQARHGSNALLMTIAFVGILVVINYLANQYSQRWDLTEDQSNSLAPETVEVIESLQTPVKAEAFFSSRRPVTTAQEVLEKYKASSNGKFDYELVDPETNPVRAQQAGISGDGVIVLNMDGRTELVTFPGEEEITGALVRLANPGERAVYFLTGHGEYSLDRSAENNYGDAVDLLKAKNYKVAELNLLAENAVPDDALALVVGGPTKPISQKEVDLIEAYMEAGGSLVYLSEPRVTTEFGDESDPLALYLLEKWGVIFGNDLVIDQTSSQPVVVIGSQFVDHAITRKLQTFNLILPTARSIRADATPPEIMLTELAFTAQQAWGETDIASIENGQLQPDPNTEVMGPVALAVSGENSTTGGRVIVVGDSDFASSQAFAQLGNGDFFINSIDWAAEQENLLNLTPKQPTTRLLMTPQQSTMGLILLGSVFLLPGIVIFTGVSAWLQRRRRG